MDKKADMQMEYVLGCTMLCLGPLTNLALAIKLDPTLGNDLKHLYLMGGNYQGESLS